MSAEPKWTREAPKESGWYWTRSIRERELKALRFYPEHGTFLEADGEYGYTMEDVDVWPVPIPEPPTDPVRIEVPGHPTKSGAIPFSEDLYDDEEPPK